MGYSRLGMSAVGVACFPLAWELNRLRHEGCPHSWSLVWTQEWHGQLLAEISHKIKESHRKEQNQEPWSRLGYFTQVSLLLTSLDGNWVLCSGVAVSST